jgi:hypothetical protein
MRLTAAAGLLALCVSACSAATQKPAAGGQRDLITLEEIQASKNSTANAWDFIAPRAPNTSGIEAWGRSTTQALCGPSSISTAACSATSGH